LDLFNRFIDQRWQSDITATPTDIDRCQYGYDQNSNRLWKANVVGTAAVSSGLDEAYVNDSVSRLTQMQRGVLSSGVITGTPSTEQDWTLDPTSNWSSFLTKASGTTTLNQHRDASAVNEITAITESTGPTWIVPAYDAAGSTTTFPEPNAPTSSFTATFDAWNRMTSISNSSGAVATYSYDGRRRCIVKYTAASSETRHFYYTNSWQDVEERIGTATTMDKQYAWGVRYVDELVCRDDASPQRLYACQDANANLTSITDSSGNVVERYLYDPFGVRSIMNSSWVPITASAYSWQVAFQGLMVADESGLYGLRRAYNPSLGCFVDRSRWGYIQGRFNLYDFCNGNPTNLVEPFSAEEVPYDPPGIGLANPPGIYPTVCDAAAGAGAEGTGATTILGGGTVVVSGGVIVSVGIGVGIGYWIGTGVAEPCIVGNMSGPIPGMGAQAQAAAALCQNPNNPPKPCKPCVPKAGTNSYREDTNPASPPHRGVPVPHWHGYVMNQNPLNCQCFWNAIPDNRGGFGASPPPPGYVPIGPVGGGGFQ
jgi:RHS repeat-associated protein